MELTPEEQFNAEPPEKMIPRMFAEGFEREAIIETLIQLAWPPEEATYLVDAHVAKVEGRPMPPRLPVTTGKPPPVIVVLCALGLAGIAANFAVLSSSPIREINPKLPAYLALAGLAKTICYLGLLRMRRKAVIGYLAVFLVDQLSVTVTGYWNPGSCIFSLGVVFTSIAYWSKMK